MSERRNLCGIAWVSNIQTLRGDLCFHGGCPSVPESLGTALGGERGGGAVVGMGWGVVGAGT